MTDSPAFDLLRPFAWLATIAFLVGFVSYLALGPSSRAVAHEGSYAPAFSDTTSGPASEDWNIAKHI